MGISFTKNVLRKRLFYLLFLLVGMCGNLLAQQNLSLVAEVDFSVKGKESAQALSLDMVDGIGNTIVPIQLSTDLEKIDTIYYNQTKSSFLDKSCYAITYNPTHLDSLRLMDYGESGEWGFIISAGKRQMNQRVLTCLVGGLKNLKEGKNCKVVLEYCNPHLDSYFNITASNPYPHSNSSYNGEISVNIGDNNHIENNHHFAINKMNKGGMCLQNVALFEISPTQLNDKGELMINVNVSLDASFALMIKSIKVFVGIEPTISGSSEVCIGGYDNVLSANETFKNSTIQWYKNESIISGATKQTYTHTSGSEIDALTEYHYIINTPKDTIRSASFKVRDIRCCEDKEGNHINRQLIWQEDFGTFTSDSTYWTWDYSNSTPKKVNHSDAKKWSTCYDLTIDGHECSTAPTYDAMFTVAGNVTSKFDNVSSGTLWSFEAYCFNGLTPLKNGHIFAPDHTYQGSDFGGMLFVNGGRYKESVIYSKTIKDSTLANASLLARCFVNTFISDTTRGEVYLQITDKKTGTIAKSNTVEGMKHTSPDWREASVRTHFEGDEILLEVILKGSDMSGCDFILDDIQLFACQGEGIVDTIASTDTIPTNILEGYHPRIDGDTIRCSTYPTLYNLTKKAPEGCEYYWINDGELTQTGGDVYNVIANGKKEEAGEHNLTCIIVSPNSDSVIVSLNYVTDVISLSLRADTMEKGVEYTALATSNYDVRRYYWSFNESSLSTEDAGPVFLDYEKDGSGTISVYAKNYHGCKSDTIFMDFANNPLCFDGEGNPMVTKLIWQEDFGTFTSDSTYWTWDYTDLLAPQKVIHYDGKKWTTCYDLEIPGTECDTVPFLEGKYTVAGNVTCLYDGAKEGTKWDWPSYLLPRSTNGFFSDHTYNNGTAYGGMLFVNGGNEANDVIYSKRITNTILEGKAVTAQCAMSKFTDTTLPAKIYIRLTDVKNGIVEETPHILADIAGIWYQINISTNLVGDELLLEVVSEVGGESYNMSGNDFILDDIQLYVCTEQLDVNDPHSDNIDGLVNVYTITGAVVKTNVKKSEALNGLKKGTYYIVGYEKVLIEP